MQKKYLMNDILKSFVLELANNSEVTRMDFNSVINALNSDSDIDITYCELKLQIITIEKTKDNLIKLCDMLHFAFNGQTKINNLQLAQALMKNNIKYIAKETNEVIFDNATVNEKMKKVYKDNSIILSNAYYLKCNGASYNTVIDVQKTLAHFEKMLNKL